MIQIINQRIFVEGKETTDALTIGEALIKYVGKMDIVDGKQMDIDEIINETIKEWCDAKFQRKTPERDLIIEFILKENEFYSPQIAYEKFIETCFINISRATFYNTVNIMVEHGILVKQPQKFKVNR